MMGGSGMMFGMGGLSMLLVSMLFVAIVVLATWGLLSLIGDVQRDSTEDTP